MKECVMKNTNIFKFFGIIALIAVIGFYLIGCDASEKEDPLSFEGTWDNQYGVGNQFVFSGDNFIYKFTPSVANRRRKGTFTYSSTNITFTCTHQENNNDGNWVEYEGTLGDNFNDVSPYTLTRKDSTDYLSFGNVTGKAFKKTKK
jgi:hypothetical protein